MQNSSIRWANLFLFFSVFFGAIIRFAPTIMAKSPINDGGMFYVMIEDLKANHFLIPAFTSYNHLQIPFAYPPLSFYAGSFMSLLGISTFDILRYLPPFISTLSIIAFYWMSSLMLDSKPNAALATLAYSLMPRSFSWYIMGGGLSRTFGIFFLFLACASAWNLFTRPASKYILLTALFGTGALLSHPETGLHTAAACALIWFFKGRNRNGLLNALFVAFGVLALTSPWWGTVLVQHGLSPFQAALNTGGHSALFWIPWITFDFAEERFVTLFTAFGLVGLALQISRKDWFLPIWLFGSFVIEPRSSPAIAIFPLAMMVGIGLADLIIPGLVAITSRTYGKLPDWTPVISQSPTVRIVLGYVMFSAFAGAFFYDLSLANYIIPSKSQDAMQWAKMNTPDGSRFIVLTGRSDPFSDPSAEWFPVYADRTSQNTIQGREWLLGKNFAPFLNSLETLQNCLNDHPSCIANWAHANQLSFEYLFIEKNKSIPGLLLFELRSNTGYTLVFENEGAAIFERK